MRTDREPFFPKTRLRSTAGTILRFAGMRTRRQESRHAHATQNDQIVVVLQIRNVKIPIDRQAYRHVRTVMPHARQRSLNEELVSGVTTSHKPKRSLYFHIAMGGLPAGIVCLRSKHSL